MTTINNHLTRIQKFADRYESKSNDYDDKGVSFKDEIMESVRRSHQSKFRTLSPEKPIKKLVTEEADKGPEPTPLQEIEERPGWWYKRRYFIFTWSITFSELLIAAAIFCPFLVMVLSSGAATTIIVALGIEMLTVYGIALLCIMTDPTDPLL